MRKLSIKQFIPRILFSATFILLLLTSYPSIGWWNSGGYAAWASNFSIPDPGGSILFVLLGKVFITFFFFLPAIKAITLISIISSSLAAVIAYYTLLIIFNNLPVVLPETGKIVTAFFTSLSIPFLYSIWAESTVSREYVLGLLLTAVLIYCSFKIWFSDEEAEKTRLFFLITFILGIDFTAHRLNTPFIPVALMLLIFPLRKELKYARFWLIFIGMYLLGFSLNLFVLIRSASHPAFAMDDVQNFSQLFAWINMRRYGESNFSIIFNRRAPFWSYQVNHMYLRYFGWNFLGTQGGYSIANLIYFSYIPFLLGIIGFVYSLIKKFKIWILITITFFFFSFSLVMYSNIREGFDLIREIDRLFIPSFYVFIFWVGIGLYFLINLLNKLLVKFQFTRGKLVIAFSLLSFLILPLNIITANWEKCNRNKYYFPEDFAYNLLIGCEKNAVLFTNGDNDTFPLWYLQSVGNVRKDVAVVNLSLLNTNYYVQQLQQENKFFTGDSSILNPDKFRPSLLAFPLLIKIAKDDTSFSSNNIDTLKAEYEGRSFGKKQGLLPQDKALISLLEKNGWKRPVYFAATVNQNNTVGLSGYLGSAGIIQKLVPVKGDSILPLQMGKNLLQKYRYRNFNNKNVYADRTAVQLFNNYRHLFILLSRYYLSRGDKEKALQIFNAMRSKLPDWRFTEEQNHFVNDFKNKLN